LNVGDRINVLLILEINRDAIVVQENTRGCTEGSIAVCVDVERGRICLELSSCCDQNLGRFFKIEDVLERNDMTSKEVKFELVGKG
jgi:hypothetical protein